MLSVADERSSGDLEREEGVDRRRPADWAVPEIAAVVVLLAVGLLVLGGLASGVAAAWGSSGAFGPGAGEVLAGSSIEIGAEWADPVLAMVLLGVLCLCWWQVDGWSSASDHGDPVDMADHIVRSREIAGWVSRTLVLTLAGSVALFVGVVLANSRAGSASSLIWSRDIYEAASVLAVTTIASGGIWASGRLRTRSDVGTAGIRAG